MESYRTGGVSRRSFLKRAGLGALGAVGASSSGGLLWDAFADLTLLVPSDFGRIFPGLPPFFNGLNPAGPTAQLQNALVDIGKPGGLLDPGDQLVGPLDGLPAPVALIVDSNYNGNGNSTVSAFHPDNPTHTAGTHFMGQFMDHDMTFDTTSTLGRPTNPSTSPNARTPYFDLDSVYGQGPTATPQFYSPSDPAKLNIGFGGIFEDLPRDSSMRAIIPDPRNDENLMIAGLHCAFILFHNHAVDYARAVEGLRDPVAAFAEAKRLTLWHYQWLILNEFLPKFIGPAMVNDILSNGRQFYKPKLGQAVMPVEFQGACYRFGHSMVRPSYRANLHGDGGNPFFGLIFDPNLTYSTSGDPDDLRGGFRAARRFIGWQTFFDFGVLSFDGAVTEVKRNKQIGTRISTPLFTLPIATIPSTQAATPLALPQRNLLRQVTWSLPSGQSIAQAIGTTPLTASQLSELSTYGMGLETSTPLWYYILKEAMLTRDTDIAYPAGGSYPTPGGLHLGPVGARIVGEVIIGLLQSDPSSWLYLQPNWTPTLQNPGANFRMVDFLTFAGVDPRTRHNQQPAYA